MSVPNDTTPEAARVWAKVFRAMPVSQKWRLLEQSFTMAKTLHEAGMRLRDAQATRAAIGRAWLRTHFRLELSGDSAMGAAEESLAVLREVAGVLDRLDIPYALGGSMASSIHGIPRFTLDADLTVKPFPGKEAALASAFGPDYYLSLPAIKEAVQSRSCFNIIHTRAGFKVDVFVRKDEAFEQSALERRVFVPVTDSPGEPIAVLSPEDTVLFKLQWFRLGQESAPQQLKDVAGVLQVKGEQLDVGYLNHWAAVLKVDDLLRRVREKFD